MRKNNSNWMDNNVHMKEVISALTEQRDAINRALESLLALTGTAPAQTTAAVSREFFCEKHPDGAEFSKKGVCKTCQSERMRNYWSERRKPQAKKRTGPRVVRGAEMVFSKRQRCPKCGLTTRFERARTAGLDEFWTCMETGCELKIGNYKIPVDRDYQPKEETKVVPESTVALH